MTSLARSPRLPPIPAATDTSTITPAQRLRSTMAAVRVSFTWMGTQKTLTPEQKAQAAEAFDAEGQFLSAGKKLLDTRHPAFRAVTAIRGKVDAYWKGSGLPFPEPGVRLIKHDAGRGLRRPDDRLPHRARRRRRQPRPPLRRAQAGRPRAAGLAVQPVGLSRDPGRPVRRRRGISPTSSRPITSSSSRPGSTRPSGPGLGPVRGGRPARRAGVPRRVRPAGRPPHRADHRRRRGRPAQGLPRLGRRQPRRSSSSGSGRSTSGRTTSSTPWSPRPSGRSGGSMPRISATATGSGRPWPRQLTRVQTSLDAMLVERPRRRILRQADRRREARDAARRRARGQGPRDLLRGDPSRTLGRPRIVRASIVEPDDDGRWHADLRLLLGPVLGPFACRSEALAAEVAWLEEHWLPPPT